jgi:hypothetical protein
VEEALSYKTPPLPEGTALIRHIPTTTQSSNVARKPEDKFQQ